ncbi:Hypothetical protein CINCED_3A021830 [Cinara cedri]|uniref:Uncharacterized protein n=1 Tax=Cinara cedri TaxID=506608 RepID=A0A5E4NK52_9HEMI|nr:Hypothetical protein CINCED_3A021830 [Cinara cedri]
MTGTRTTAGAGLATSRLYQKSFRHRLRERCVRFWRRIAFYHPAGCAAGGGGGGGGRRDTVVVVVVVAVAVAAAAVGTGRSHADATLFLSASARRPATETAPLSAP